LTDLNVGTVGCSAKNTTVTVDAIRVDLNLGLYFALFASRADSTILIVRTNFTNLGFVK
jgi:hypothetical protein